MHKIAKRSLPGTSERPKPQREIRKLADLKPHPRQSEFFKDLSEADRRNLANSIQRNGLEQAIHVLPKNRAGLKPGTILRGHQRVRALLLNGLESHEVTVRHDLAEATAEEIERFFIEDNLNRRQLDPLEKIRAAIRLFDIENDTTLSRLLRGGIEEVRNAIGDLAKMSPRNAHRYINVIRAPKEVQDAFRDGKLRLIQAASVAGLYEHIQNEIAERIRAGEDPKKVIADVVPAPVPRPKSTTAAIRSGMQHLEAFLKEIEARADKIRGSAWLGTLPVLRRARKAIRQIVDQLKDATVDNETRQKRLKAERAEADEVVRRHKRHRAG